MNLKCVWILISDGFDSRPAVTNINTNTKNHKPKMKNEYENEKWKMKTLIYVVTHDVPSENISVCVNLFNCTTMYARDGGNEGEKRVNVLFE